MTKFHNKYHVVFRKIIYIFSLLKQNYKKICEFLWRIYLKNETEKR